VTEPFACPPDGAQLPWLTTPASRIADSIDAVAAAKSPEWQLPSAGIVTAAAAAASSPASPLPQPPLAYSSADPPQPASDTPEQAQAAQPLVSWKLVGLGIVACAAE